MKWKIILYISAGILAVAVILPKLRGVAPTPEVFDSSLTLTAARELAASENKPVLTLLTADWCPACQALKRGALANKSVASVIAEETIPVYLNVDEAPNDARSFPNVSGIPTIIIEYDGQEIGRSVGSRSAKNLRAWLDKTLALVPHESGTEPESSETAAANQGG